MMFVIFVLLFFASIGARNELRKAGIPFGQFVISLIAIFAVLIAIFD